MSVSILEVIEAGGYNPVSNKDDAEWLLSKVAEFEELVEDAADFLEELDRLDHEAEEVQERADDIRKAMREDWEEWQRGDS